MKYIIFFYILQARDLSNKKKVKKSVEEITKELLESIVNQRLEDLELINKADNGLTLQEALQCLKQYGKYLQNEKRKIINIACEQGKILHQYKESEEFIDTAVKKLKTSKSTFTFKINLYKVLKKNPLLKLSNKSIHYFKNFKKLSSISGHFIVKLVTTLEYENFFGWAEKFHFSKYKKLLFSAQKIISFQGSIKSLEIGYSLGQILGFQKIF